MLKWFSSSLENVMTKVKERQSLGMGKVHVLANLVLKHSCKLLTSLRKHPVMLPLNCPDIDNIQWFVLTNFEMLPWTVVCGLAAISSSCKGTNIPSNFRHGSSCSTWNLSGIWNLFAWHVDMIRMKRSNLTRWWFAEMYNCDILLCRLGCDRYDKTTFIELTKVTQLFLFASRVTMLVRWLVFPPLLSDTGISQQLFKGSTLNFCLAWAPEDESSWLWESNDFSSACEHISMLSSVTHQILTKSKRAGNWMMWKVTNRQKYRTF